MRLVVVFVVVDDDDDVVVVMMRLALFYRPWPRRIRVYGRSSPISDIPELKGGICKEHQKVKERCAHISVEFCFVLSMPTCYTVYTIFKMENLVGLFGLGVIFMLY